MPMYTKPKQKLTVKVLNSIYIRTSKAPFFFSHQHEQLTLLVQYAGKTVEKNKDHLSSLTISDYFF